MQIVQEIVKAKKKARDERAKKMPPHTKWSHPSLAMAAQDARRAFARAQKVVDAVDQGIWSFESLSEQDKKLHHEYHSGLLKKRREEADRKWGHGAGVEKPLSIETLAKINIQFDRLNTAR